MLEIIVQWFLGLFGLAPESSIFKVLEFFLYDSIKIIILLFVMITAVGFLRSYLPQKKVKAYLTGKKLGLGNLFASVFGAITPFCSCSSIPIFLSFVQAGIPLGVTLSFLITSPLINEYLVVLMLGFFGWKITIVYVITGIILGTSLGMILGKMGLEKYLVKDMAIQNNNNMIFKTIRQRVRFGYDEAVSITKKIWLWILAGVGLGAVIHNYVPQELIQSIISKGGIFTVPIAVLIGVPIYGSCAAIVPIAVVLFQKGVPLGTALAFMMGTAALSLPEAVILRRAMKLKLIAIYFGIVTVGIIFTGYLIDFLQPLLV